MTTLPVVKPEVKPEVKPVAPLPDKTLTPDKLCPKQGDEIVRRIEEDV